MLESRFEKKRRKKDEEEEGEGERERERLFGILIRQQDTVGTVHVCEELNVVMKDVLLHPVTLLLFYYLCNL